ncbi:glycosyltransferase [Pseudomonas eucalypticola]|uniref:Beta-monoglucosyldiacylglycerol synthase n=1 Tax=Pseudomonas eucalypticola TaxID=2599595 RepID=A0A7D5DBT9_9PSED|nr:glycosyltransferase [Pseudomonas eucalypticola]QKZ06341.1 glycosyltransferase [Pseudomonas eucalypticola]
MNLPHADNNEKTFADYWNGKKSFPPAWPAKVSGFSYAPFKAGQTPGTAKTVPEEGIRDDLKLLQQFTDHVRCYSSTGANKAIAEIAVSLGITVTLGIWIGEDLEQNEAELAAGIALANSTLSVVRVIVGNESLFKRLISPEQMIHYLDRVRQAVQVPVTTAEPWHLWSVYPELIEHVDLIAAHVLPYWEFIEARDACPIILARAAQLQALYPRKKILLAEVGWPSQGHLIGGKPTTPSEQAILLRSLTHALNDQAIDYFLIEAFDQPWKIDEGNSGPHWGIFDGTRRPKFPFQGPVDNRTRWRNLFPLLVSRMALRKRGWLFLAVVGMAALVFAGAGVVMGAAQAFTPYALGAAALWTALIGVALFSQAHEMAEAAWSLHHRRVFYPVTYPRAYRPKVSIHVPCHNEPAAMVMQTLDALAQLDYPDYEVLVIDNNTPLAATWLPVQAHCRALGQRFRFYHVSNLQGFKAGALNYALALTAADAELVAVIDSDYCVHRDWLKQLAPLMLDPHLGFIQSPQDYRDHHINLYNQICYDEYRTFFHVGMVIRNNYDAIIQHGTMTIIRKSVLDQLKWSPWCICEDAELGLNILSHGYSSAYCTDSYGRGLIPHTFEDFQKQRFRWAYGAVQILRHHRRALVRPGKLSIAQRYHFVVGWLPWLGNGIALPLTLASLAWSVLMVVAPTQRPAPWLLTLPILALTLFKLVKIAFIYLRVMGLHFKHALLATVGGMALHHTIAKAVIYGAISEHMPFVRTPKYPKSQGWRRSLHSVRDELALAVALMAAGGGIQTRHGFASFDLLLWQLLLLAESLPYLAALFMAFLGWHCNAADTVNAPGPLAESSPPPSSEREIS